MKIEHTFEYDVHHTEITEEFCAHDSEYQANVINGVGLQFKVWSQDKARAMTYVQMLEIAEQLNDFGKWFIKTLSEYAEGGD